MKWFERHDEFVGVPPGVIPSDTSAGFTRRVRYEEHPVTVVSRPPQGVDPVHCGVLLHGEARKEDIAAQVVDFAIGGRLRVSRVRARTGILRLMKPTWRLDRPAALDVNQIPPNRRVLYAALLGEGSSTTLAGARKRMSKVVPDFREALAEESVNLGWHRKSGLAGAQKGLYLIIPLSIFFTVVGILAIFSGSSIRRLAEGVLGTVFPVAFMCCMVGISLHAIGAGPRRTAVGSALREQLRGFSAWLGSATPSMFQGRDGAELFNRYLPWAVATGNVDAWLNAMAQGARSLPPSEWRAVSAQWSASFGWIAWRWADSATPLWGDVNDVLADIEEIGVLLDELADFTGKAVSTAGSAGGDGGGGDGDGDGGGGDGGGD